MTIFSDYWDGTIFSVRVRALETPRATTQAIVISNLSNHQQHSFPWCLIQETYGDLYYNTDNDRKL